MRVTFLLKKKSNQKKTLQKLSGKFAKKIKEAKENFAKIIFQVCKKDKGAKRKPCKNYLESLQKR